MPVKTPSRFLTKITSAERELARLKLDLIKREERTDDEREVNRIVEDIKKIRQQLFQELYGKKMARIH